ncbi:MAG: ferritin family protein [bacterium]
MKESNHKENARQRGSISETFFKTAGDAVILSMALKKEEYSINLYKAMFSFVEREDSKSILKNLIEEETEHFNLLREALVMGRYDKIGIPSEEKSLEMPDYLIKEELKKFSKPEEIVKLAIRREEEAEEFYLSRIHFIENTTLKNLYQRLAQEETNHRQKLLKGYDDLMFMHFA